MILPLRNDEFSEPHFDVNSRLQLANACKRRLCSPLIAESAAFKSDLTSNIVLDLTSPTNQHNPEHPQRIMPDPPDDTSAVLPTAISPDTRVDDVCHFMKLPPELRFMIHRFTGTLNHDSCETFSSQLGVVSNNVSCRHTVQNRLAPARP